MIRTVYFDLGKVLADFNWKPAAEKIALNSDLNSGEIYALCTNSSLAMQYENGKIDTVHFFQRLKVELGFNLSSEILMEYWSDIFTPIQKHLDILDEVRTKYPVGLISNTNAAHVNWINGRYGFLDRFPKPTYSFQTGYMKPQAEIFETALRSLSVSAEDSLFIDDLEVNTNAAGRLGMKTIHLKEGMDLAEELKKFRLHLPNL